MCLNITINSLDVKINPHHIFLIGKQYFGLSGSSWKRVFCAFVVVVVFFFTSNNIWHVPEVVAFDHLARVDPRVRHLKSVFWPGRWEFEQLKIQNVQCSWVGRVGWSFKLPSALLVHHRVKDAFGKFGEHSISYSEAQSLWPHRVKDLPFFTQKRA